MMNCITGQEIIKFYRSSGKFGFLSNLYKKEIEFEGIIFATPEHAYQYGKFKDEETRDWAMKAPKPFLIAILGHGLLWDITDKWSEIKIKRMHEILRVKFQDSELKQKLLETKDAILVEDSKTDAFWGIGKKETGKNMLGKLLMKVRKEIMEGLSESDKD